MGRINKARVNFKALDKLMKDLNRKISIKVGILGKGTEIHPDTDLTMAELGAVHEFGADINVTNKMRGYLGSQGLHLKKDTTQLNIPARSFLREPLLGQEGKKILQKATREQLSKDPEQNKLAAEGDPQLLTNIAHVVGVTAMNRVKEAFETGGFGQWQPISEYTKQNRKGSPENPPLTSTGDLKDSITYEVKEL